MSRTDAAHGTPGRGPLARWWDAVRPRGGRSGGRADAGRDARAGQGRGRAGNRGQHRGGSGPVDPRAARRTAAVAVPVLLAVGALAYPGLTTTQVQVDDGGVWVTNGSRLVLGRYNVTIDSLTGGLLATSPRLDVLQQGTDVLLLEPGRISVVDPTMVVTTSRVDVPPDAEVDLQDRTVLVTDPSTGNAWLRPLETLATLRVDADEPDLTVGLGGAVALGVDGVARGLTADGEEVESHVDGEEVVTSHVRDRDRAPGGSWSTATVVGEDLVATDGAVLSTPDGAVPVPAAGVLQRSGDAADVVALATRTSLVQVDLSGGDVTETPTGGSGTPAVPVRVGACLHAAWASATGSYAVDCGDGPAVSDLDGMDPQVAPVFRVNRGRVVLNDATGGFLWVPQESSERREPAWDTVLDSDSGQVNEEQEQVVTNERTACTEEESDPLATADQFGVRAGATAILPVLDNDSSRACGVLAVASLTVLPEDFGTVVPVYDGRALQVTLAPGATGQQTFRYTVSDGRATTTPAEAEVTVTVRGPDEQGAPVQVRTETLTVEQGGEARYDLLGDLLDPDGDDLQLLSATSDGDANVSIDPDGLLTVRPQGSALGRQTVTAMVSDGATPVEATLAVDVVAAASAPPRLGPVHAATVAGTPVTLDPLGAVLSRGAEPARLASVGTTAGLTVDADLAAGTFTVTAQAPGSYVVPFVVVSAGQEARGLARIDVVAQEDAPSALVATRDVLYLPATGEGTLDPLANDVLPPGVPGFVLDVTGPSDGVVEASVHDHQLVTVRRMRSFDEPVELTYTLTDGVTATTGTIAVVPLPAPAQVGPPVVDDTAADVRTGGVVTLRVLDGARDPDGEALSLVPQIVEQPAAGTLYVTGDVVRYQAPEEPGTYQGKVEVVDASGNRVGARVQLSVHGADADAKAPARPRDLEVRVFAGESVRIDVPLVGIDEDGDGVMLQGPATAPTLGRITDVGSTWLEYEALPGETGTDTFQYAVEDWTGQRARAQIRVAVVPRPDPTNTVTAVDDLVSLRPGQTVRVPVLENDSDASGEALVLGDALEPDGDGITATVQDGAIDVVAGSAEGVVNVLYTVTTATGGFAQALLVVEVRADAALLPPVAADVVVRPADTIGLTEADVDVLSVARNPSGPVSDLTVSLPAGYDGVARVAGNGDVVVTLGPTTRTVPYLLTSASAPDTPGIAFITVPALGDFPPVLRSRAPALSVVSGETLTFDLSDQVRVAPGKEPQVADSTTVQATRAEPGAALVVDADTLTFTPQAGYAGPASVSAEVADGPLDDPTTRVSLLTFPVTVLAAEAYPPTFTATTLEVGAGDAAVSVDLLNLTSSVADGTGTPQRYSYALDGETPLGFDVTLTGSRLTASAAADAPVGTRGSVGLAVSYGGSEPVLARVELRVVPTRQPLPRVLDRSVPDARAGQSRSVDVLAGAYNPFPETPLRLVGATLVAGSGDVATSGESVVVTPEAGRAQVMTIRFQAMDATGDAARIAEGTLTVTVVGPPDPPPAPSAVPGDTVVDLTWSPPAMNGSPIYEYQVTTQPGGTVTACPSTVCQITGLVNNTDYTFTVIALNEVGASPPGAPSAPVRPDVIPDAPASVQVVRGDGALTVSWAAAVTRGSPVSSYVVQLEPGGIRVEVAGTLLSRTIDGLANGTEYTATVQAVNAKGPGPVSAPARGIPAGVPLPPGLPTVPNEYRPDGSTALQASWPAANGNGDAVTLYEVEVTGPGGTQNATVASTSWSMAGAQLGATYQIRVRAQNGVGWSAWGPPATARVWTAPGAPAGVRLDVGGGAEPGQGSVTVSWTPPGDAGGQGITVDRYRLDWVQSGVARSTEVTGTSYTIGSLAGGTQVTASVTAISSVGATGPAASAGPVTAVTRPQVYELRAELGSNGRVTATWRVNDGGSGITGTEVRLDGDRGVVGVGDLTWTSLLPLTPGDHVVRVVVENAQGASAPAEVTVRVPEPTPEATPTASATP